MEMDDYLFCAVPMPPYIFSETLQTCVDNLAIFIGFPDYRIIGNALRPQWQLPGFVASFPSIDADIGTGWYLM